jgi:hypothetical protein
MTGLAMTYLRRHQREVAANNDMESTRQRTLIRGSEAAGQPLRTPPRDTTLRSMTAAAQRRGSRS